ncbi:SRPBCC family protein [Leekyejoonella antrihumi]|nr:SRPBCC family protein [Leekyejoonella antrihumi]
MQFHNEFRVPASIETVWPVLLDLERVVRSVPGATVDSVTGDTFTGRVTVKLGPMRLTYRGEGLLKQEASDHRITVEAHGTEQRGGGSVSATITATLEQVAADLTGVRVCTDLDLTGRPAQFGRGIISGVAAKLIATFADNLALEIDREPDGAEMAGRDSSHSADPGRLHRLSRGSAPIMQRMLPSLGAIALVVVVVREIRGAQRGRRDA